MYIKNDRGLSRDLTAPRPTSKTERNADGCN